jgi:hypothetical protein
VTEAKRAESAFRNHPAPRVPRLVAYQTKGQLPLTLLALIVIVTVGFVWWWIVTI